MSPAELNMWNIVDRLPGALLLVDLDGYLVNANKQGRKLLGVQGDVQGISLSSRLAQPEDRLRRYLNICGGSLQPMPGRISVAQADGSTVHYAATGSRIDTNVDAGSGGLIVLWIEVSSANSAHSRFASLNSIIDQLTREVRARRQAEALLEAEKRVLGMVVCGEPLEAALELLALAVEDHTAGMQASVLLLDESNRLRHIAAPNMPDRYIQAIDGVSIGPLVGSCGAAASTDETVIVQDIATDSRWKDFRDIALQCGLRACWSTPVRGSDKVIGTLALYYDSIRAPTDQELKLIENSALIAGIAIERYQTQKNLAAMYVKEHEERERAEAESHAKDHFLAILSHELRNPLSSVANAAYALDAQGEHDPRRSELLEIIINSTDMLKRILDDLLDLSRLNTGKLGLQIAPLNFADLIKDLIADFRTSFPVRKLHFVCNDDDLWIDGDQARLQQVVHNLMGNARKYSDDTDEITVELSASEQELLLSVRDTGQGIDAGIVPDIFSPFVQADNSLDRAESGLGLGLALVRQFAEIHGGSVSAHSEGAGLGSEFVLRLPRCCAPETIQSDNLSTAESPRSYRVMVVEDNEKARKGLCRLLEIWGHHVTPAADGEQALKLMRENPPELALVDIGLPGISGYDLARTVRSEPLLANIRLIALTGYGQLKDRELTTEVGFEKHLVKPVDRTALTEIFYNQTAVAKGATRNQSVER